MYNLHLSPEQLEIRDTVRDFVTTEVRPVAIKSARLEAADRPLLTDLLDKASQMGLRTLALSEYLGGTGADALTSCIVMEELAAGDPDIAAVLGETSALAHLLFDKSMNDALRDRYLPAFLEDDRFHLAFADHEPDGDAALGVNYHRPVAVAPAVKTTAVRSGNVFVVNGVKDCVGNAPVAKLFAVQVTTTGSDGVSTLLIPHDTPGLTVRARDGRWFHGACGEIVLADCRVPAENLLGLEGRSPLAGGLEADGRGVPLAQSLNVGIGRAAYEAALDYAGLRVQGGRRIVEHQAIGAKLASIAVKLEVARAAVWQAAWASDHPEAVADRSLSDLPLQRVARAYVAEAMLEAAKDAAECFGAMGVMKDMPLQKYVHDARVCLHSDVSTDDERLRLAEQLAGFRRPVTPSVLAAE